MSKVVSILRPAPIRVTPQSFSVVSSCPVIKTPVTWLNSKSLLLDGVDEYLNLTGCETAMKASTTGSISFWIKPVVSTPSVSEALMCISDTDGNTSFSMFHLQTSGVLRVNIRQSGVKDWELDTDSAPFTGGEWTHVCITHNNTAPVIYINAAAVAQTFNVTTDKTIWVNDVSALDNTTFGARIHNSLNPANHFNGNVDEILFFDTALTAAEVTSLYNSGSPKNEENNTNAVHYYRCGDSDDDNFNSGVANEWEFTDLIGSVDVFTVNAENGDVENDTP